MTQVTIIITNYNKGLYLNDSIESALCQNFQNFEILIIDDGSTDNSREIIETYREHSNVRIEYQDNHGVITTRNKAIDLARGIYILQLDGDDKIHPNYLSWTVPLLEKNRDSGIAYCKTEFFGDKNGIWNLGKYSLQKQLITNQIVITALFRKEDYLKTDGYRKDFSNGLEDWDFWLSLIELGLGVVQVPEVGFYYRISQNSRNLNYSSSDEFEIKAKISKYHQDLYIKNGLDSANLLWYQEKLKWEIKDLQLVKESAEYKLGKLLLLPFRWFKSLI